MEGDGDNEDNDVDQQEPFPDWKLTKKLALTVLDMYRYKIAEGYTKSYLWLGRAWASPHKQFVDVR